MRIEGWSIEAFGAFRDFSMGGIGPNLNVLLGPNEAGKSTLLEFMRGVLFGFPLKRGKPIAYAAPGRLRHGGRLFLQTELGPAAVERFAGKDIPVRVLFADGRCGGEADLQALLRQADDSLFRNVFAISLSELQDFGTLSASGVRDKIFSAGIAGAGRSARAVISKLEDSADSLFKPRANGGAINSVLIRLEDLRLRLTAARAESERYRSLVEEEESAEASMRELSARADQLRKRYAWFQDLIDLWPVWQNRSAAERRLCTLPAVDTFPPQAAVRAAEARNRIATARERCEALQAEIASREQQRDAALPELQPALVSLAPDVVDLALSVALHRKNLREHSPATLGCDEAQRALERKLLDLGADWDEARLRSFDVSIPRREEIRFYAESIEEARLKYDEAERAAQLAARELDQQKREAERIRYKRDTLTPPKQERFAECEQALRRLRVGMTTLAALQAKEEPIKVTLDQRRSALEDQPPVKHKTMPLVLPLAVYGLGALLAATGLWQIQHGATGTGAGLIQIGALAIACALFLHVTGKRTAQYRAARAESAARMQAELAEAEQAANEIAEEIGAMSVQIARDAAILGIDPPVTPESIENKAAELDSDKALFADWKRLDESLSEAASKCAEFDMHARKAQAALDVADQQLQSAEDAWSRKKIELCVSESLSPDGLFQFFTELERARDLMRHRDQKQIQRLDIEHHIVAWEERAQRQLRVAGREPAVAETGERLLTQFGELQRACNEQLELERRVAGLEAEILSLSRQRETARAALVTFELDLRDLFREAGVSDSAAFEEKLAIFEERKALTQEVQSLDQAIRTRLGDRVNLNEFTAVLAQGDVQGWTEERAKVAAEMAQCGLERDQAVREHDAARRRRVECESSADIPSLEAQLEAARVQLEEYTNRWRVETLAAALLRSTLADFKLTRQPAVITEAGKSFHRVTSGRYIRLLPQDDQETLLVEMANGETRSLDQLSRGTAEQLYLCLRLAFAREFARRGGALPVVMDDVLVNFDPERSRAVAALLAEFAADNQVLLFTCHPQTAAMFEDVAPGHTRINLART